MYMLVGIEKWNESDFLRGLIEEQSVVCMPGSIFGAPNSFRVVLAYPEEVMREACRRIGEYCRKMRTL